MRDAVRATARARGEQDRGTRLRPAPLHPRRHLLGEPVGHSAREERLAAEVERVSDGRPRGLRSPRHDGQRHGTRQHDRLRFEPADLPGVRGRPVVVMQEHVDDPREQAGEIDDDGIGAVGADLHEPVAGSEPRRLEPRREPRRRRDEITP